MTKSLRDLLYLHFLNDGVRTALVVMLPLIAHELMLSYSTVGMLGGVQAFYSALFALPAGFLATRLGRMRMVVLGLLIYSLGAVAIGLSTTAAVLVPIFIIGCVGFGVFHVIAYAQVAHESPVAVVGRNMANITSIGDLGRIAVSSAALFVAALVGWRLTAIGLGVAGVVSFLVLRFGLRKGNESGEVGVSLAAWLSGLWHILRNPQLRGVVATALIDSIASNPLIVFIPFLLLERGVGVASLGLFTAGYFAGNFGGKFFLGRAVDRFGNRNVFVASELLMALTVIAFVLGHAWWYLLIVATLMGLFSKGTSPVIGTLFSQQGVKGEFEKIFAIAEIFVSSGAALAPFLMGIIADHWGVPMVFYVCAAVAVLAPLPLLLTSKMQTRT